MRPRYGVRTTPVLAGLYTLTLAGRVVAAPAEPQGRHYQGPTSPQPSGPPQAAPPSTQETGQLPSEPSPSAPVVPTDPVPDSPTEAPEEPESSEESDDDDAFFIEDLSDDPEALQKELAVETKDVKGPSGMVSGQVQDMATGGPLIGATIEAIGTEFKTKTDIEGKYSLALPPGTYELRVREDTHEPRRFSNVVVAQGDAETLNADLKPLAGAGETVVVEAEMPKESAGARLAQRKEAVGTRDILSRDDITKSGGGSTSAVARRIVGATVVDNKYLFVRGLGHRYGNTLLDRARVPSPEPELRTVPLDVFPSSTLSAINVQKTFTPDVPADFAGASTQLETRDVPEELVFGVGANIGVNTATTGRERVTTDGYGADWVAFGNLSRRLPRAIPTDNPVDRGLMDDNFDLVYSAEDIERFGEALQTTTKLYRNSAPPNFGVDLTLGYGDTVGNDGKIGFLIGAEYGSKLQTLRGEQRQFGIADGELSSTTQVDYDVFETVHSVAWSSIALVKYDVNDDHRLSLSGFYSRGADDQTRYFEGTANNVSSGDQVATTRERYTMRSILTTRLGGRHEFPDAMDLGFDWFGSYSQARRDDPHLKDMLFTRQDEDDEYLYDQGNDAGKFLFMNLLDDTESGAFDLWLPFEQWSGNKGKVQIGAWVEGKQRTFFTRRFAFQVANGLSAPPGLGNVFTRDTIGGGVPAPMGTEPFFLRETTRSADNYDAHQEIYAGYALLELPLTRWWRIAGGVRFEASDITVAPYDLFGDGDEDSGGLQGALLEDRDWLPSVSMIFSPGDKHNIRVVGTRTLARPEFRELARFTFTDFVGGYNVRGNPWLTSTKIWNVDLRWEWFPSASEVIAVSAFYKYFDDPIERVVGPSIPFLASFLNADEAHNVGGEIELRKNLEFFARDGKNASERRRGVNRKARRVLADFSVGVNFAYIYSRVNLPEADECEAEDERCEFEQGFDVSTSRERPLQGQSPFVANAFLSYDNEDSGTNARVLFNTFGPYISSVSGLGLPDIYQEPVHRLDLVLGQRIYDGLSMSFEVENLLDWPQRETQGGGTTQYWRKGMTFNVGLSYEF